MNRVAADRKGPNSGRFLLWGLFVVLVGFVLPQGLRAAAEQGQTPPMAPSQITVALTEKPVWELENQRVRDSFLLRGQYTVAQKAKRLPGGKYPAFKSDAPLYGNIEFGTAGWRRSFRFAVDELQAGGGYDLLYFDANGDSDLTNDRPRKPAPQSESLARPSSGGKETYFEPVAVAFDFGSAGQRTLELLPHLEVDEGSSAQCIFIAARVHTGEFQIASTSYQAFLGYRFSIRGPLNQPSTGLILVPRGEQPASWVGGDQLNATHLLGGRYYRFSCTPAGDKLSVCPYEGPLGVLEIGAGGRNVEKLAMRGSLRSKESSVAIRDGIEVAGLKAARQCRIPVGDYYPAMVDIDLGNLRLMASNNYHTNAQGQRSRSGPVHGITIRADKPYVLDFSNKPTVVFTEPAVGRQIKPGDEVRVKAVLIDPVLDIMIRRLYVTAGASGAREQTTGQPVSLDPKVVIKRGNGEIVAEGVMPFG
jgi:hypothetical protein